MSQEYPPVPETIPDSLSNMFGMSEMERAAKIILKKVVEQRTWEVGVDISMFQPKDPADLNRDEEIGFLYLLAHGWLEPDEPTGNFVPRVDFAHRIMELAPITPERRHQVETEY